MKRVPSSRHHYRQIASSAWMLTAFTLCASSAQAADRYWGNSGTDYNTPSNWLGGVPVAADRGIFGPPILSPVVSGPATANGFTFFSPGFSILGATGPITLTSTVTNSDLSVAIYMATAGTTTISAPIDLGVGTAAGLSAVLGGEIVLSGDISGTRGIQKLGSGTVTLSGNNSFAGGVGGDGANGRFGLTRLNINSNTALGTGNFTIGQGNGGSMIGNTSGSARTLANAVTLRGGGGLQSTWDLPANGSGDLTFQGLATVAPGGHTMMVHGGTVTFRGGLAESAAGANLQKIGSGTVVFGGLVNNTGTLTISGGTLALDMSTGGSFANAALPLVLTNSNFSLKGASSGASAQTMGAPSFGGRAMISIDGNGGSGTTLTLSNTWTKSGTGITLGINLAGNSTLSSSPTLSAGGLVVGTGTAAFATVKDGGGVGFATTTGSNVTRYTDATQLTATASGTTTNFVTKVGDPDYVGNTLTFGLGNRTLNTLHLDTSTGAGIVDLNGTGLTLTDRGLLVTGTEDFAIQNGALGSATELVIHQYSTGELTINSLIGGNASNGANVTKAGPGKLVLAAGFLYTGNTIIGEGTVDITGSVRGPVNVSGSNVANGGVLVLKNPGAVSLTTITVAGNGTLNQTVANAISGTAAVSVNGFVSGATANLSHANDYTGQTTLASGVLNIGHAAAIGTGILSIGGGRLDNTSGAPLTLANNNAITIGASFIFNGSNSLNFGTGPVTVTAGSRTIAVLANTLTFDGSVGGAGGITKIGGGTMVLNNANTYAGVTVLDGGLLLLNNNLSIPGGIEATGGASNISIQAGSILGLGAGNFLRPVGTGVTDVQISMGGFAAFGANRIVNLGAASTQLTWATTGFLPNMNSGASVVFVLGAPTSTHTVDFQNPINLFNAGGSITRTVLVNDGTADVDAILSGGLTHTLGTPSFAKLGAGTLDLSGLNIYSGLTSVAAGMLLVNGELSNTSAVNVAGGAGLGGEGFITTGLSGSVTLISGAELAPGGASSSGTLTVNVGSGQFDISGAASVTGAFHFDIGTTSDQLALTVGTLNIGTNVLNFDDFDFNNVAGFGVGTYVLFDTSAFINGSPGAFLTGTVNGLPAEIKLSEDVQDVLLVVVPEPGSAALLLGGLGMLMGRRRRR